MDRSLDDVINDRRRLNRGDERRRDDRDRDRDRERDRDRARERPREPRSKPDEHFGNIDNEWMHDMYDEEGGESSLRRPRGPRGDADRPRRNEDSANSGHVKLRVDNIHYDLSQDELEDLFQTIGPLVSMKLQYDRAGRSVGTAYVTYFDMTAAKAAIREFDGANANGQPIRLTIVPIAPDRKGRNPFASAQQPGRSLFERVQDPEAGDFRRRGPRDRSRSPGDGRRSNVSRPAPENIDRYIPGGDRRRRRDSSASMSPPRRFDSRRGAPRGRGGRERGGRAPREGAGGSGARPRKTQEELDAEMDDYWSKKDSNAGAENGASNAVADVDMIE